MNASRIAQTLLTVLVIVNWCSQRAQAVATFKREFDARYVKPDSNDPRDRAFADAVLHARCSVCHVGSNKNQRNAYGRALSDLLDKTRDKDNIRKIRTALDQVAAMPADAQDPASPTFGQLIAAGHLPGTRHPPSLPPIPLPAGESFPQDDESTGVEHRSMPSHTIKCSLPPRGFQIGL